MLYGGGHATRARSRLAGDVRADAAPRRGGASRCPRAGTSRAPLHHASTRTLHPPRARRGRTIEGAVRAAVVEAVRLPRLLHASDLRGREGDADERLLRNAAGGGGERRILRRRRRRPRGIRDRPRWPRRDARAQPAGEKGRPKGRVGDHLVARVVDHVDLAVEREAEARAYAGATSADADTQVLVAVAGHGWHSAHGVGLQRVLWGALRTVGGNDTLGCRGGMPQLTPSAGARGRGGRPPSGAAGGPRVSSRLMASSCVICSLAPESREAARSRVGPRRSRVVATRQ